MFTPDMLTPERVLRGNFKANFKENVSDKTLDRVCGKYPIDEINGIPLDNFIKAYIQHGDEARLLKIVDKETADKLAGQFNNGLRNLSIELSTISKKYINIIINSYLDKIIKYSRDPEERKITTNRNRRVRELHWESGDLLHATSLSALPLILEQGNFAGEFLKRSEQHGNRKQDLVPLFMDSILLTRFDNNYRKQLAVPPGSVSARISKEERIFLLYGRRQTEWDKDKDLSAEVNGRAANVFHSLLLVGVPSTEISAIILNSDNAIEEARKYLEKAEKDGLYVPGFTKMGNKFF